jgi:methionyl-tRNA formyltransferase
MKNIAFIIYREWAFKILDLVFISLKKKNKFILVTTNNHEVNLKKYTYFKKYKIDPNDNLILENILKKNQIEIAFFYGWSWIISENIYKNFLSLCLHPSKLPKYKGGSPLQHQIIDGIKQSAVSIFKIYKGIDTGPIYKKVNLSLNGELKNIFKRISFIGAKITIKLLNNFNSNNRIIFFKQRNFHKIYKRRKKKDSEFKLEDIKKKSFFYLNNFVRCLNDPYPNAYFKFNNKLIFITKISKIKKNSKYKTIGDIKKIRKTIKSNYIELNDSYARIEKGYIKNIKFD